MNIPKFMDAAIIETNNPELNYAMIAVGDKCLVREDVFKTGKECPKCRGKSQNKKEVEVKVGSNIAPAGMLTTIKCDTCGGHGKHSRMLVDPKTLERGFELVDEPCISCNGDGFITCTMCNGTGVMEGTLILSKANSHRVSTGVIISMGPMFGKQQIGDDIVETQHYEVGERVSYGNYAGTEVVLEQKFKLLFLREHEILSKCYVLKKDNTTLIDSDVEQLVMTTVEGR